MAAMLPVTPTSRLSSLSSAVTFPSYFPIEFANSLILHPLVALRTQMSTLKHNIRQQQAQLQNLENTLRSGPRPFPPGTTFSSSASDYETYTSTASTSSPTKLARRTSYEILSGLAGPDSSIPLPRRDSRTSFGENGIREGIPIGNGSGHLRSPSPTRTLSRT